MNARRPGLSRIAVSACTLLFSALLLIGTGVARADQSAPNTLVVGYSAGPISRTDAVAVAFAKNMVATGAVGTPLAASPFVFDPPVDGKAVWKDRRTLSFRPEKAFASGRMYSVRVNLADLPGHPADGTFSFHVDVVARDFDITFGGFDTENATDPGRLTLKGTIQTADVETDTDIMNMLKADQDGRGLNVRWVNDARKRRHQFEITGIKRLKSESRVTVAWSGAPIGVSSSGKKIVEVPKAGPFRVLDVQPVFGETRSIEVRFSDPLDTAQNLDGLITLSNLPPEGTRTEIHGNRIQVFVGAQPPGTVTLTVAAGIRSAFGQTISEPTEYQVAFEPLKPAVRFIGKRVIVPTTRGLTLPIETANLRAVVVTAIRIPAPLMPQFLQVNTLAGQNQLNRVGKTIFRRVVPLNFQESQKDRWVRHGLDIGRLVEKNPGGVYRIELSFLPHHIAYDCPGLSNAPIKAEDLPIENPGEAVENSFWNYFEGFDNISWNEMYRQRHNPCNPGYYRNYYDHKITVARNILVSDIGLIAKTGSTGDVLVVATDIRTATPLTGVPVKLLDYQQQVLASGTTDARGMVTLKTDAKPYLVVARHTENNITQYGYLLMTNGTALSVSHFDVAGQTVKKGLRGFLYGERGVWRPGDPIHLTFILLDTEKRLPPEHPVILDLFNPRGQRTARMVKTKGLNGFYTFQLKTAPDAPTGDWLAKVKVGGALFQKVLKIETVKPNRLKVRLSFGEGVTALNQGTVDGHLEARWLSGATAKDLKADVRLTLTERTTTFPRYEEYSFDDPVRTYASERHTLFQGRLDDAGHAAFSAPIEANGVSPGMLTAHFFTRVFEPGGDFSTDVLSMPFHPYKEYVGLRVPPGDKARGMLLVDQEHTVRLALVDTEGHPVAHGRVKVTLYKIRWRWWWEKGKEQFTNFASSSEYHRLKQDTVDIVNGKGTWDFEIKYPSWGRYMIRVEDENGGHIAGKIFYVDWPGWAGRGRKDIPGAATVLSFSADKTTYNVGENVVLTIPAGKTGRALVSIENGSRVLSAAWVQAKGDGKPVHFTFATTRAMVPNVYAHVTYLQPHLQSGNDRPIRMYGVIPIRVDDPASHLEPVVTTPESFEPESTGTVTVKEAKGRPMTYTLAVVDEGLLDLTRFATPDPWHHFFQRTALGVRTWDLYDLVAGAYGGVLEQMLAIGGSDAGRKAAGKRANRFPPMVRFYGPFALAAGKTAHHRIDVPQYVGSVRVMVVAGQDGAFGAADRSVFVRKPLMVLGTLPRVMGIDENVDLPVSVFAMTPGVKHVTLTVTTKGPLAVQGTAERSIAFGEPGDEIVTLPLKAARKPGIARVSIHAASGDVTARQTIEIQVRIPSPPITQDVSDLIAAGGTWRTSTALPGLEGTNTAVLEVSRIPPLNLEKRLGYLIAYPHGCIEQTTSSVFPQLYLDRLMDLSLARRTEIQANIRAGIERLRTFQLSDGGFGFWPGSRVANAWGTNYAGHFLVEAANRGYWVPPDLLKNWKRFQRNRAGQWNGPNAEAQEPYTREQDALIQAYRLYTLALAGSPELGAMNRLRESKRLDTASRWRLAAAYQLAGQPEAATQLVADATTTVPAYHELSGTFGSGLRDQAMILETLQLMGRTDEAIPLIKEISDRLSSEDWLSTQTTAYALMAMAKAAGDVMGGARQRLSFDYDWNGGPSTPLTSKKAMTQVPLPVATATEAAIGVKNTSGGPLYARLILTGIPAPGGAQGAANGLLVDVTYRNDHNESIDVRRLAQGTDFMAVVSVKNIGHRGVLRQLALTQYIPSGWEIHNERLFGDDRPGGNAVYRDIRDDRVNTYFDLGPGERKEFTVRLTATYRGRYYLPMISAEAMYDATINGWVPGQWVEVVREGEENDR